MTAWLGRDPILARDERGAGRRWRPRQSSTLRHGFPSRRSTAGEVAFQSTPPELSGGTVYRFNVRHIMQVDELRRCSRVRLSPRAAFARMPGLRLPGKDINRYCSGSLLLRPTRNHGGFCDV